MKITNIFSSIIKTKARIILSAALILAIIAAIICLIAYNPTPNVDVTSLNQLIREKSDLITAELNITSMSEYKDAGVTFINKSDFIMVCKAQVWAGIDVENVKIDADNDKKVINVSIPKSTIKSVKVDPSSIRYFDEKFSLFNKDSKEDANQAIQYAEKAAISEATNSGLLQLADKQSATLISGLLANAIPEGYTIESKIIE